MTTLSAMLGSTGACPHTNGAAAMPNQADNPRAVPGDNSRKRDVKRTAEEIAATAKFLRNNASADAPYRGRALAISVVAPISDAAFRLFALRLIFANSEGEDIFPSQKTLGLLLGKNERHIRRLDDELKQELYPNIRLMTTMRRRRASATFNLISGISMGRLVAELSGDLDKTEMSGQADQDRADTSYQDGQDRTDLAGQSVKTGHFGFKTGQECPPTLEEDPNNFNNKRAEKSKSKNGSAAAPQKMPLADDWQPSEKDRDYARSKSLAEWQIDWIAEGFTDYWRSPNAVRGGLSADWPATWRNGVRMAIENQKIPKEPPEKMLRRTQPSGRPGR
jgi:hypothetical protein